VAIRYQTTEQIQHEAMHTPVPGVLDLRYVFELVVDCFDDEPLGEHGSVEKRERLRFHIFTLSGYQCDAIGR
jgi:hypothetical protein